MRNSIEADIDKGVQSVESAYANFATALENHRLRGFGAVSAVFTGVNYLRVGANELLSGSELERQKLEILAAAKKLREELGDVEDIADDVRAFETKLIGLQVIYSRFTDALARPRSDGTVMDACIWELHRQFADRTPSDGDLRLMRTYALVME